MADGDQRFMDLARHIAGWSPDRSRKTSAVIVNNDGDVLTLDCNRFPRGVRDIEERHQRPAKYTFTEHAERNAIYQAAKNGVALKGTTIYIPWYPCADCARAIKESGIATMVAIEPDWNDPKWAADFEDARTILAEGGVVVRFMEGEAPKAQ